MSIIMHRVNKMKFGACLGLSNRFTNDRPSFIRPNEIRLMESNTSSFSHDKNYRLSLQCLDDGKLCIIINYSSFLL